MGITAESGPFLVYGITQGSTGQVMEYNEERGPSLFDMGIAVADPRYQLNYDPGSPPGTQVKGFFSVEAQVDYVPFTKNSSAYSGKNSSALSAGGTFVVSGTSAVGLFATTIVTPENGKTVSVYAIDSTAATLNFGQSGTVAIWNPAAGTGRAIWITANTTTDTGCVNVAGYDMYGFKVSESIPLPCSSAGAGTVALPALSNIGQKAIKYIASVSIGSSSVLASTAMTVGFYDVYGLPIKTAFASLNTQIRLNATSTTGTPTLDSTGAITPASTQATQGTSSPDVRGTYLSTTASDGTLRLQIRQRITSVMLSALTPTDTSALFGATQYST